MGLGKTKKNRKMKSLKGEQYEKKISDVIGGSNADK